MNVYWVYTIYESFRAFLVHSEQFLDASLHLYKRVCPSVGRSVGRSVGPSVRPFVTNELKSSKIAVFDQNCDG